MIYFDKIYGVEFSDDGTVLVRCPKDLQGDYSIPDTVECIGDRAFKDCSGLTSVTIPNSVESIGEGAFENCSGLSSVTIGISVTSIGSCAFRGCSGLTSINVDSGNPNYCSTNGVLFNKAKTILIHFPGGKQGAYAIPNSVTSIKERAFRNCSGLTSVTIPNSVESIGDWAFQGCSGLTSINVDSSNPNYCSTNGVLFDKAKTILIQFPDAKQGAYSILDSVTSIEDYAFSGCSGLTSVTIGNSVESIGEYAFLGCSGLTSINVDSSNPNYCSTNGVLFDKAKTILIRFPGGKQGAYTIPNSVEIIGFWAFQNCSGLTSVTIPNSVESIRRFAFEGCRGLTSVTIPNSVTSIEMSAFKNCSGLTSVTIPNSVTSIGYIVDWDGSEYYVFDGCYNLKEICVPVGQKERFAQMDGLKNLARLIVERDNEELTILLNIAKAYELGIGLQKSLPQALVTYMQAVEKGCPEAAYHLGEWYEQGEHVPQDLPKAIDYYRQAAKSGILKAQTKVEEIQKTIEEQVATEKHRLEEERKRIEAQRQAEIKRAESYQAEYLFFDTETTGLPNNYRAPVTQTANWPRLVQLAWLLVDKDGNIIKKKSVIIYPEGFSIPRDASDVHGITTERARRDGVRIEGVLEEFMEDFAKTNCLIGHNIDFDKHIIGAELCRSGKDYKALMNGKSVCTMRASIDFCAIPSTNGYADYKWPKLQELYTKLFNRNFADAHDALADITATKECFFELRRRRII